MADPVLLVGCDDERRVRVDDLRLPAPLDHEHTAARQHDLADRTEFDRSVTRAGRVAQDVVDLDERRLEQGRGVSLGHAP